MNCSFHPDARSELDEAVAWYDRQAGLGLDFACEVQAVIDRIAQWPEAWPILDPPVRRCQTDRFPYGIVYVRREQEILVLAVMHLSRRPDCWQGRA